MYTCIHVAEFSSSQHKIAYLNVIIVLCYAFPMQIKNLCKKSLEGGGIKFPFKEVHAEKTMIVSMWCEWGYSHTWPCPQAPPKSQERGLVLLAKIPVCAVSAVFIWSRGITFVHCQFRMGCVICWPAHTGIFESDTRHLSQFFGCSLGMRLLSHLASEERLERECHNNTRVFNTKALCVVESEKGKDGGGRMVYTGL